MIKTTGWNSVAMFLTALLAGGCSGHGDSPGNVSRTKRLTDPRVELQIAAARELLAEGPAGLPSLTTHLWTQEKNMSAEESSLLSRIIDVLRRQEFAQQRRLSPLAVQTVSWDIDPHYRAWILAKTLVTRDEPLEFTLIMQRRFADVPDLWIHHYDLEWTSPDIPGPQGDLPFKSISEQVPCRHSTQKTVNPANGETILHGRVDVRDRASLFANAPPRSLTQSAATNARTIQAQIRFFAQTGRQDLRSLESGYRKTGFFPITILNTSRSILDGDKGRYLTLLGEPIQAGDPRRAAIQWMDGFIPPHLPTDLALSALGRSREPATDAALLPHLAAAPDSPEKTARIVERANAGSPTALKTLAASLPLHPAGFTLPSIATPEGWNKLSEKNLKKFLGEVDPETTLAAARLLARVGRVDREISDAFKARLLASASSRELFDALLPLARELLKPATAGCLTPYLDEARVLAPSSPPPVHPLLAAAPPKHDIRVCDAAAAAFSELTDWKPEGLYEDVRNCQYFLPTASRDAAIARLKSWWEKNKKRFS